MIVGRTLFPYVVLCLIPLTTYLGDRVILTTSSSLPLIVKCAVDNLTHLLVALFSYIYVICSQDFRKKELAVFASLCGVLASFIDVDHFIAAGSLNLKDATSLATRPILHCTSLFLATGFSLVFISACKKIKSLFLLGWAVIIAGLTHHLRDGYRRGLWMCPIGATPNYSYASYLCMLIIFSVILKGFVGFLTPRIRLKSYEGISALV